MSSFDDFMIDRAVTEAQQMLKLRDINRQLVAALEAAQHDLEIAQREIQSVAPEALAPSLPMIREALAKAKS